MVAPRDAWRAKGYLALRTAAPTADAVAFLRQIVGDPWSWTGALLALAVVLVMAVFRPAYRAAHVDPVTALRSE